MSDTGLNVDYIVLAEFDIDRGSSITEQYPKDTGINPQFLAEMMLPDGVHKWEDDWTFFFLNRGISSEKKSITKITKPEEPPKEEGPKPLKEPFLAFLYEFEESTGKGWVLQGKKSLTLWPKQIEIREKGADLSENPLHVIAKHDDLAYTQLEPLFSCVLTATGIALGFRFSQPEEETSFSVHVDNLIKGVIVGEEEEKEEPKKKEPEKEEPIEEEEEGEKPLLYCINRVLNFKDNTARRGAVVRALALCTRHPYYHVYKPLLILGLDDVYKKAPEKKEREVLAAIYDSINAMDLSAMPDLSIPQRIVRKTTFHEQSDTEFEAIINYGGVPMPIKIPLIRMPEEVANNQVIPLIKKFGAGVVTILNAILAQKRVLFLGFDMQADIICTLVLACYAIVSPPLVGILHRFFPYTNLSSLDFLEIPGYVAGVANPMFESHQEWWDILCNVSTGKITLNPTTMDGWEKLPSSKVDSDFYSTVEYAVSSHLGDDKARSLFQAYIQHIIDISFGDEEFVDSAHKTTETTANSSRIEMWKKTASFEKYSKWREEQQSSLLVGPSVPGLIRKLRVRKDLDDAEMLSIYKTFVDNIKTEDQVIEFLSYLPDVHGGLYPIAVSLFHDNEKVRQATVELFRRLDTIKSGKGFISSLNLFLYLAYNRQLSLMDTTS